MTNKQEFTGKTLVEAIEKAANSLGVNESEIEYEVKEEASKGLLGIGSKPYVIIAWSQVMDSFENNEPILENNLETDDDMGEKYQQTALEFISSTIKIMKIDAKVVLQSVSTNTINFELIGNDIAILIGKHGVTLDSLQYLADVVAYKKYPCKKRIIIDADNHRGKRSKELEEKAARIADMVIKHGKEAVMEPQNAKERRIIHLTLANHPKVKTYSEGEGIYRHVVISPK